jgi:hypothetical protein
VPSGFAEGTSTAQNSKRPHRSPGADFFCVLKLAPSREDDVYVPRCCGGEFINA